MDHTFLLHNCFIEIFLLILTIGLYYIIPKGYDYTPICLLGSYITLKAIANYAHYRFHLSKPIPKTQVE